MRFFILGIGVVAVLGGGCGGGVAAGRPPTDGGADRTADAAGEAGRPAGVTCPPVAAGEKRGLGACCVAAGDCAGGVCWNGFCTQVCAAGATACGPAVAPSPLPAGATLNCSANAVGDGFSYCLPGSLRPCSTAGGGACPTGEGCALGLDPAATTATAAGAYAGLCLTKLQANAYLPAGNACQPEDGPYACEDQGGYLGSGCLAHRCTHACTRTDDCPVGMQCQPPPYSPRLGGAVSFSPFAGVGVCLGLSCGQVHGAAGLAVGQVGQQGADSLCLSGEVCAPTLAVGAAGDTQYLTCVPARPGALPFGAPCSPDAAQGQRCADDTLCAERGGMHFCSSLCRIDSDCPTDSYCVEDYASAALPDGSVARLAMCTPRALLPGTVCRAERDCAAGQACMQLGARSNLLVCKTAVGPKSVGEACAAAAECRSGECLDRALGTPTGANRTVCTGPCGRNSDCGAGQICLRVVRNNNGTVDDPRDDVVLGICTTLDAPALAGACATAGNCVVQTSVDEIGGDTCDPTHHTCYAQGAHIGDPCAHRANCPLGAYCRLNDPRFPGGACLSLGCDPAATMGVDACPAGAICLQRPTDSPLYSCYPACAGGTSCVRASEGYACEMIGLTPAQSICIWQGGP